MALSFQGTEAVKHFDRIGFKVTGKRMYASYLDKDNTGNIFLDVAEQKVFCEIDSTNIYPVPNKWGERGITTFDLNKVAGEIVMEALLSAYNAVVKPAPVKAKKAATVDSYLQKLPKPAREKLTEIRAILKAVAPKATEALKWGVPVFEEKRILFAYSAHKSHMNFVPTPAAMEPFLKELAKFKTGKGSISFPYDKPLPKSLIKKIARYRLKDVRENDAKWICTPDNINRSGTPGI